MANQDDESIATRASLLGRLKNWEDAGSWEEFSQIYSRLIRGTALRSGLTEAEAKDVEQETLLCVAKTVQDFESNPQRGSFKHWLLNLTRWRITDQYRKRPPPDGKSADPAPRGDETATVERLPDPGQLETVWENEWHKNILETALTRLGRRIKPKHLQIFELYALQHWPAARVARDLGVNIVQVYIVNHRVTKLMKLEVAYLEKKLL